MFMEKIDLPRVTCDLFSATKGFEGSGCGSDKPRAANDDEARAYADFIRRKCGLPDLGKPAMHTATIGGGRGQRGHFHYVGATFGQHLGGGEYEPGAFSVLFPGANQMRATVTLETLDDGGNVTSSQTMPIEPKKGGVVWSKDDVRKACGPVEKVKAARTPTRIRRTPTAIHSPADAEKRRRAIMRALHLRAEVRRLRAEARQMPEERAARPDAPTTAPDAILSDLAAAEALMRGEGYVAPALPRLRAGMRIVLHCASYRGLRATAYHQGTGLGWAAVTDCGRHLTIYPDASDVWSPCPAVDEATPTSGQAKRTPAHERAIRRAWAERKARRHAERGAAAFRDMAETTEAELQRVKREADNARTWGEALREKLHNAECRLTSLTSWGKTTQRDLDAAKDQARLAEQDAAEALAAREDLKRILADAEQRLAAAEAENAQLWAEIETLTAPVPALAA